MTSTDLKKYAFSTLPFGIPGIYCGCKDGVGHCLYTPGMVLLAAKYQQDFRPFHLDGTWLPQRRDEGAARMLQLGEFVVVSWHDFSIDTRPNSNSAFLLPGAKARTFGAAIETTKRLFPEVWARLKYAPFLVEGGPP
jgi:hypothetical protein